MSQVSSKSFAKQMASVPNEFIDELFRFYDENTTQTDFAIDMNDVAKWLDGSKETMLTTLRKTYKLNVDYIVNKRTNVFNRQSPNANNHKMYLITPDCFKRFAMLSRSKNADQLRTYFIEVETLFLKHRQQLLDGMKADIERLKRNQKNKKVIPKAGYMYVIRTPDAPNAYKLGRTKNLRQRLRNYNTGVADDVELLYRYRTDNIDAVENCAKSLLKKFQYRKYKEVYSADLSIIKQFVAGCGQLAESGAKLEYKLESEPMQGGGSDGGGTYMVFDRDE